jgi:hypothetical protein
VDITTPFYSGEGFHYQMQLASTEAVDYFWYVTTPEGLPVQQGEGGTDADTPAIDAAVFAVPAVCLATKTTCALP